MGKVRKSSRWLVVALFLPGLIGCENSRLEAGEVYFRDEVVPVLEARCGAGVCHGVTPSGIAAGEQLDEEYYYFLTDEAGKVSDWQQARENSLLFINAKEDPDFSSLIRKPLPIEYGGEPHGGRENFVSDTDPALQVFRRWIELEKWGGEDPQEREVGLGEVFFQEEVLPHLIGRNCAAANCHGQSSANGYMLDIGLPPINGAEPRFSAEMIRENYEASRRFLSLHGNGSESRLLKKSLPLNDGGITHRGSNRIFFTGPDDPAARAIERWAELERRIALGLEGEEAESGEQVEGIIFIEGPPVPGPGFGRIEFVPGSDLYLLSPASPDGEVRKLTGALHEGDAHIRDPAIDPAGEKVVFSMRREGEKTFSLYELELETGAHRRLTDEEGDDLMPTIGPGGTIYFASNRHRELDEEGERTLAIYELKEGSQRPRRITFAVGDEFYPRYFDVGDMQGRVVSVHRRRLGDRDETVGFSTPVDFGSDHHIFFGITARQDHFTLFEEMPDGRALTVMGDPGNLWEGGVLGIVDRNLGPELGPGESLEEASLPAFAKTLRLLDASSSTKGVSFGGIYRDPVAMPDGTVLVAWAPGPFDLSNEARPPRFEIYHLELEEAPRGCSRLHCLPQVKKSRRWLGPKMEGNWVYGPRPIYRRPLMGPKEVVLNGENKTTFTLTDVAIQQGLLENLFASGIKEFRTDLKAVRFIEALPPTAPGAEKRWAGQPIPARILGTIPLEKDRSVYVEVPPHRPFRVQFLNGEGMAVGHQPIRWLFNWPGQDFPESAEIEQYDQECASCHGSRSGNPAEAMGWIDSFSSASATLATFSDRNPRRPKDPVLLGEGTARSVGFVEDIQPILDANCLACHANRGDSGEALVLEGAEGEVYSVSYESLMAEGEGSGGGRRYVDAPNTRARTSRLMEVIVGRRLDVPGDFEVHPPVRLKAEEVQLLVEWIESGAAYERPKKEGLNEEGAR